MSLRPAEARWFETYTPREQTVHALEVLARTGLVELETERQVLERVDESKLRYFVERFRELAGAHAQDLPNVGKQATALEGDPVHLANQALHRLRVWSARVDFVQAHLEHLRTQQEHLELLAECMRAMTQAGLELDGVFRKTRFLCKCLFACPKGQAREPTGESGVDRVVPGEQHDFVYVAGLHEHRHLIRRFVVEEGCEQLGIPAWLKGSTAEQRQALNQRLESAFAESEELRAELKSLRTDPEIAQAKANVDTLHWYLQHAAGFLSADAHCHVTGWTTATDPRQLQQALAGAGIRAVIRSPAPPSRVDAPVAPLNTWWAQPFRPIMALWGTPGRREVDPTGLLALVVPLLFGYMFPDVGHGLVLALFAAVNYRRWPRIRFLLPCGLSAMVFGVLFGDAFGFDELLPALWLRPLDDPETILVIPILFGMGLMLLGLAFAGLEARWRGELGRWLLVDGAVLLIYASLLASLWLPQALWGAGLGGVYYLAGSLIVAPAGARLAGLPGALGDLLLSVFELIMNTLSFLRVGAFALAHAALSHAVMTLAEATELAALQVLVILVGNVFAMVMEGLLVFVQTTRLVLFEFFIRFLRAEGRLFRPERGPQAVKPGL